jgi:non-ribosomal peptide synthetase component F
VNIFDSKISRSIALSYKKSKIGDRHALNIANTFIQIFESIISNPGQKLGLVKSLSPSDESQIALWSNNSMPHKIEEAVIHQLVHKQTQLHPKALAVDSWDETLTYSDLEILSSSLASHLVDLGVGPETFVPFSFNRSRWAIVAIFA